MAKRVESQTPVVEGTEEVLQEKGKRKRTSINLDTYEYVGFASNKPQFFQTFAAVEAWASGLNKRQAGKAVVAKLQKVKIEATIKVSL